MRRATATIPAGLLALAALTGCQHQEEAPTYPENAIRLRQNVPTPVGDHRVFAVNIEGTRGIVVVEPPDGAATNVPVTEGEHYDAGGLGFDVLDVVDPGSRDAEPGAGRGVIVIVVTTSS